MNRQSDRVSATIETDGGPISVIEFSTFLHDLRAAYVLCLAASLPLDPKEEITQSQIKSVADHAALLGLVGPSLSILAAQKIEQGHDLVLLDISRSNPLEIVFGCVVVALAGAVILSGGTAKINKEGLHVKLPPLGKGIAELKRALALTRRQVQLENRLNPRIKSKATVKPEAKKIAARRK